MSVARDVGDFCQYFIKIYLSSTYKISAIRLVNEAAIYRIVKGGIFFKQSDWLSAKNRREFYCCDSGSFFLLSLGVYFSRIYLSYILCIDNKHVIVQSFKKYGIVFSFF